jgi:hypothetical protein
VAVAAAPERLICVARPDVCNARHADERPSVVVRDRQAANRAGTVSAIGLGAAGLAEVDASRSVWHRP